MPVRDNNKKVGPGYRTLTVLALTPKRRGLLSQNVLRSEEPGVVSEPAEAQRMRSTVQEALVAGQMTSQVSRVLESGLDDVAVWRPIWEQNAPVVGRVGQRSWLVEWQTTSGAGSKGPWEAAATRLTPVAMGCPKWEVPLGQQAHPKRQGVHADISACSFPLPSEREVRRPTQGSRQTRRQTLWLVPVRVLECPWEPWGLSTTWPGETEAEARRICCLSRQRWGVEERFTFPKICFAWDEGHVLAWQAMKTAVALAWIAAGFVSERGVRFSWEEVPVLATLGGWVPQKGRIPGTIVW